MTTLVVHSTPDAVEELLPLLPDALFLTAPTRAAWDAADSVVVEDTAAAADAVKGYGRREHVTLLAPSLVMGDPDVWERAVRLGVSHVVCLPDAAPWLVREHGAMDRAA